MFSGTRVRQVLGANLLSEHTGVCRLSHGQSQELYSVLCLNADIKVCQSMNFYQRVWAFFIA
jgi:hypothetical protein